MAESGSRTPASALTALANLSKMRREGELPDLGDFPATRSQDISDQLRKSLEAAGLKGFKRGGVVNKDGIYRLHRGEVVLTAQAAKNAAKAAVHKHERSKHPGEGLTKLNGGGNGGGKAPKGSVKTKASLPGGYATRQPGGGKHGGDRSTERLANKLAHRLGARDR